MSDDKVVMLEVEEFISLVRARPCLWDLSDPQYCKRDLQRVAWMELAEVTHAPVSELKRRWRGLRDTFARQLRRVETEGQPSEAELSSTSKWRHFRPLLFLRRGVHSARRAKQRRDRDSCSRERGSDRDRDSDSDPLARRTNTKWEPAEADSDRELATPPPAGKGEEPPARPADADPDGDTQFLLSLAPFLRDVPRSHKLVVRARITQVLIDAQNDTRILTLQPQL